jgi:hypothetical protein
MPSQVLFGATMVSMCIPILGIGCRTFLHGEIDLAPAAALATPALATKPLSHFGHCATFPRCLRRKVYPEIAYPVMQKKYEGGLG